MSCWFLAGLLLVSCWFLVGLLPVSCWFLAGLLLVSCWSLVGLLLISCWSLAGLLLVSCWSLAGLLLVSCWFLAGSCCFLARFSRIVRWCLSGVLVVFVGLVFLVMSWWCLDGTQDWQSPWQSVFSGFWLGHTMHRVIATVPSCCHADNHDS